MDVFFTADASGRDLLDAVQGQDAWRAHTSRWGSLRQLVYRHPQTDVVFTVDREARRLVAKRSATSTFYARLNLVRPDFYGREAVDALAALCTRTGAELVTQAAPGASVLVAETTESEALAATSPATLLARWRTANAEGWTAARQQSALAATTTRVKADAYWTWQYNLLRRRSELDEDCYVPRLFWVRETTTGQAWRLAPWANGQAEAIPEADLTLYTPPGAATADAIVMPQAAVIDALSDLITTARTSDTTVVRYLPIDTDEKCRRRAVDLARQHPRLADTHYQGTSIDTLDDQELSAVPSDR